MASGLDATGLAIKRLTDLLSEMKADARAKLGNQIQLEGKQSAAGQIIELTAVQLSALWELAQQLYDAFDPDAAEGVLLDNLCALVGVLREPATSSVVTLDFTGTNGTVIPAGTQYRVDNGPIFATTADVTIAAGVASVLALSVDTGPVEAVTGAIDTAVDVIAGVSSVTNPSDAIPGQDVESDQALRVRRQLSLSIVGAGPDQAIAARVAALETVTQALVISNRTFVVDSFGTPGKAFLTVVWPAQASNDPVWQAIWETMPAGIESYGAIVGNATDSQGNQQTVAYSLASEVDIYVNVDVQAGSNFPGEAAVKAAVQDYINGLAIGGDVLHYQILCAVADLGSIIDLDVQLKAGSAPGPADTANIAISQVQIARNDQINTTVSII